MAAGLGMLAGTGSYALAITSAALTVLALRLPHKWLRPRKPSFDEDNGDEAK